ncbi:MULTISPECIES: chemotaxis protein CheB [unclassified Sphingobium]|uniref:chemotaxis protein CheB n=1 Tax=unclassified Sphingobium TaxID=2611147 RepID=UPI0007703BAE|nr:MULTISPECIES: chemotaxis protein CheB [unclassified Sphingobium]AMK22132.1 response regulator receiver modulated CheB methylesterase [Sphingobium sp. TKS]NML88215.1 response regulator [Sphingobium sp. TB-6]
MTVHVPIMASNRDEDRALRTLIVDDSVVVRTVIERILNADPRFSVSHKTNSAEHALGYLSEHEVDLVLLDIELAGQSGLMALPAILRTNPRAKVVILSGNCEEGSAAAVEALALGASDILAKPGSGSFGEHFPQALIDRLSRLFNGDATPVIARPPLRIEPEQAAQPLACLGIGASTGGIHALGQLFAGLAAPLGVPILLTQHLPASFTHYFVQQLGRMTPLRVKAAEQGEILAPDTVYVAPGDANLQLRRGLYGRVSIMLNPDRTPAGNLPGVDPMFASMAHVYGAGAAGVVLTGMGRDGTVGARDIVAAGGWIVAQDEASSVVWGMPGSIAGEGLNCALLEPHAIMDFVARRGKNRN